MEMPFDRFKAATQYVTYDPSKSLLMHYAEHVKRNPDSPMSLEQFAKAMRDPEYRRLSMGNRISNFSMQGLTSLAALGIAGHGIYQGVVNGAQTPYHLPLAAAALGIKAISEKYHATESPVMQAGWEDAVLKNKSAAALAILGG